MPSTLPVSRLIAVSVAVSTMAAQAQNLSTLLILGSSAVIDTVERYRDYSSIDAVATDFGTSAAEYLAAALWFEQIPQPTTLRIGRWLSAAASGVLRGSPRSAAQQSLALFTAVASGGFTITKNGAAPVSITGINLSGAASLNAVAALVQAAVAGTTCVWNPMYARFELASTTTGPTSEIAFLTAPGAGTDISGLLGMRAVDSGAYSAPGAALETALACVTLFDTNYGQSWYAVTVLGAVNNDHLGIAAYIEATNTKHLYAITSQEGGILTVNTTTDIAYQLAVLKYNKSFVQYSSSNPYAAVSALARILTTDYTGNNTVIMLMFKQEPGITPENLNATQADSVKTKRCNVFVAYNNNTAIFQNGICSSGNFIDVVAASDWLAVTLQNALYNLLYTSATKVPQTDAGTQLLVTTAEAVMARAVDNGMLAPGTWTSGGFGQLSQNDFLPKGYYIYAPKMSTQAPADRALRKSVPIQIAAKLAGAVHEVSIAVTVNQ